MSRRLWFALVLAACNPDPSGVERPCQQDADCRAGLVCGPDNRCVEEDAGGAGGAAGRGGAGAGTAGRGGGGAGAAGAGAGAGGAGAAGAGAGAGGAGEAGGAGQPGGAGGMGAAGSGAAGSGGAGAGGSSIVPLRWDMQALPAGTGQVTAVWAAMPNEAYAGTSSGTILRWDGATWSEWRTVPSGNRAINDLFGTFSGADIRLHVALDGGILYIWNGSAWENYVASGSTTVRNWRRVFAYSSEEVYLTAEEPNGNSGLYRFDASRPTDKLTRLAGTTGLLGGMWGPRPAQLTIAASQSRVFHWDAGNFGEDVVDLPAGWQDSDRFFFEFTAIAGSGDDQYAVGSAGAVWKKTGGRWQAVHLPGRTGDGLRSAAMTGPDELVAVGYPVAGGPITQGDGASVGAIGYSDRIDLWDVWAVGPGDYWAVGMVRSMLDGVILRSRPGN